MAVYFVTDFHLGIPTLEDSQKREKKLLRFLDGIRPDCEELYLMGDLFDFWFEYKTVIPKGFVRLQGKLPVFGLSIVSDMANIYGLDHPITITHEEVIKAVNAVEPKLITLITELIRRSVEIKFWWPFISSPTSTWAFLRLRTAKSASASCCAS